MLTQKLKRYRYPLEIMALLQKQNKLYCTDL